MFGTAEFAITYLIGITEFIKSNGVKEKVSGACSCIANKIFPFAPIYCTYHQNLLLNPTIIMPQEDKITVHWYVFKHLVAQ